MWLVNYRETAIGALHREVVLCTDGWCFPLVSGALYRELVR
jgi:hypothetical protein